MSNAPAPKAVTKQYDFLNTEPDGGFLFSVRGGIPLARAFDELSILLAQGQAVVESVCVACSSEEIPEAPQAAVRLLDFSYALVQAMHNGLIEHENAKAKP